MHGLHTVCPRSSKPWTILYIKLLFKRVHYFLDILHSISILTMVIISADYIWTEGNSCEFRLCWSSWQRSSSWRSRGWPARLSASTSISLKVGPWRVFKLELADFLLIFFTIHSFIHSSNLVFIHYIYPFIHLLLY